MIKFDFSFDTVVYFYPGQLALLLGLSTRTVERWSTEGIPSNYNQIITSLIFGYRQYLWVTNRDFIDISAADLLKFYCLLD